MARDRVMSSKKPTMKQVRRAVRGQLHEYLDMMLKCQVQAPNGETISLLDDCCVHAVMGFGFSVSVAYQHPDHPEQAPREAVPLKAPDAAHVAIIHAAGCTDGLCDGTCMRRRLEGEIVPPVLGVVR